MAKSVNTINVLQINGTNYSIGQRWIEQTGSLSQILYAAYVDTSFNREVAFATTTDYGVIALFGEELIYNENNVEIGQKFSFIASGELYTASYSTTSGATVLPSASGIEDITAYTILNASLYAYIQTRYTNGDHRPFFMNIESVANWIGSQEQMLPEGKAFGWYDATSGDIIVITNSGISALDVDGETRPITNYNSVAERVIYDNSNSGLNATNVQEAIDKLSEEKVNFGDYAPLNRDGLADNIHNPDGWTDNAAFAFRGTAGNVSIINSEEYKGNYESYATIQEIKGKTLFVNQLVKQTGNIDLIEGHVYYYKDSQSVEEIITATSEFTYITIVDTNTERLTDLTKMFSAGKEPATVAEFNNLTRYIDTDTYNEGTPISMTANKIESIGFNAFDGELEIGAIGSTGNTTNNEVFRSKNYIPVVCGQTYSFNTTLPTPSNVFVYKYDKNLNYLGVMSRLELFPLEDNVCYVRFSIPQGQTITSIPDNNTCFHLTHSGYRNGQYEPYWKETRVLPTLTYFPEGMNDAGTACDILTPTKATKVIGSVDLGTLDWVYNSTYGVFTTTLTNAKPLEDVNGKGNIACSKYTNNNWLLIRDNSENNKQIGINTSKTLYVRDTAYVDAGTFKATLSGVILNCELETPEIVELEDNEKWFYKVDDFGTESVDSGITKAVIHYEVNLRDFIRGIGLREDIGYDASKLVSHEELSAKLAANQINYDNSNSGLDANNVQGAIDELNDKLVKKFNIYIPPIFSNAELPHIYIDGGKTLCEIPYNKYLYQTKIYVNKDNGNDTTGDGSQNNPYKTIKKALTMVVDDTTILVKSSTPFMRGEHFPGGLVGVNHKISIINNNDDKNTILLTNAQSGLVWTAEDNIWKTTRSLAQSVFFKDEKDYLFGWREIKEASSLEECKATTNSFYINGSDVYLNTYDGSIPTEENYIVIILVGDTVIYCDETPSLTLIGFGFLSVGQDSVSFSINNPSQLKNEVVLIDCVAGNNDTKAGLSTVGNGFSFTKIKKVYLYNCYAKNTRRDGFNYHYNGVSIDSEQIVFEYNCKALNCGIKDTNVNNNGSTCHEGAKIIRVNTVVSKTKGPNFADVNGCSSYCINCLSNDSENYGGYVFSMDNIGVAYLINSSTNTNLQSTNGTVYISDFGGTIVSGSVVEEI